MARDDDTRLARQLAHRDWKVRRAALHEIGVAGGPEHVAVLLDYLAREERVDTTHTVGTTLPRLIRRQPPAVRAACEQQLVDHLATAGVDGRSARPVLAALTTLRVAAVVPYWERVAASPHPLRRLALRAVTRMRDPRGVALLLAATGDPDYNISNYAARMLGRWRDPAVLPLLVTRAEAGCPHAARGLANADAAGIALVLARAEARALDVVAIELVRRVLSYDGGSLRAAVAAGELPSWLRGLFAAPR